ncbi:MAG: ATP-dependent Clp protease ATP-binding subunit [Bacteroidales bacterium]|nr:ATP-dependent Clp protease ATP-binding subunit [Bacteroidales bacterium]
MEAKFSQNVRDILAYSREEAIRLINDYIGIEHLFLGLLRKEKGVAIDILVANDINLSDLRERLESLLKSNLPQQNKFKLENIPLIKQTEKVLRDTYLEAKYFSSEYIDTEHLLLSILKDKNNIVTKMLEEEEFDYEFFRKQVLLFLPNKKKKNPEKPDILNEMQNNDDEEEDGFLRNPSSPKKTETKSKTPVLDSFGRDLTRLAEENKLDPVIGREKELERIAQILSRRKKNNPVLIGEPGVGKSAIAEGLALRIIQKRVSRALFNKRLVTLDLASLVAGTKYRGQFEERMKALLNEIENNKDIILFIDEIHTIVGAGSASGSLDASNIFKPALARGDLQCIGATTLDEYRQYIEKDGALERRFQKIIVDPTSPEETVEILNNIKEKYEDHHLVTYTDEAIKACVALTNRYITDRCLPDKAIDALDEAGSRVHIKNIHVPEIIIKIEKEIEEIKLKKMKAIKSQKFEEAANYRDKEKSKNDELNIQKRLWEEEAQLKRETVSEENVSEVIAMMTNIPIQRIAKSESARLINMEDELAGTVIGQNEAIKKVTKAIRRNRAGLKDPNKPIGTFIFLGPTGVGKTWLAKVLARFLFDSEDALVRIDMSEYMEKFAVSRLIGAPPGYVGYEEGGQLTEKVRRKPYSVVLLDEIEKAHPDVFHILLQVLDDGVLTDSLGRKVDFKNTIIIMTSNIGSRQLKDFGQGVGFQTAAKIAGTSEYNRGVIENALKKTFAPEFLNRIDDVIIFESLNRVNIHKIIDIELGYLLKRVKEMGYGIEVSAAAKDYIVEKGWDEQFGARPLKRAIQKYIEDTLAEEIIKSKIDQGDVISVDFDKENNQIEITISKPDKIDKKKKPKIE